MTLRKVAEGSMPHWNCWRCRQRFPLTPDRPNATVCTECEAELAAEEARAWRQEIHADHPEIDFEEPGRSNE